MLNVQEQQPILEEREIQLSWSCELAEFNKFLKEAKAGDKFVYHVGFDLTITPLSREYKKLSFAAAVRGNVYLFRRRVCPFRFEYIMVKASAIPHMKLLPYSERKRLEAKPKRNRAPCLPLQS